MQKRVVLLLVLLLVSLNLFTAGEEKVAVLVDELLYSEPDFQDSLNTFITSAQQCFPEVLISNIQHDVYQGIDPVGDMQSVNIRKIIYDLWQSENIVGVILVGDVPLPVFQSFEIPWDNPIYYPVALAYEDLDGSFYNDNSVGPDGLRVDGPGDDLFIDTWEPVSENNRPDIWVSVIRPRELLYNTGSLNNSFEAEDAVINGNAAIFNDSFCSGGQGVLGVGQGPLNDLVFNDIVVPADGVYQCTVYYVSTYREWPGMVSVNGKAGIILPFKFVSDSAAVSQNFPVYLTASQANSIRFFMDRADSPLPIIDKIEITVVNGYEQELVQDMIKYLEKCTSYFNGQLVIPQRGMIYSADTYAIYPPNPGEIGTISADMRDIYGEENLTVEGFNYATGQEYLNLLSNGYKLNHLRTHSGAESSYVGEIGPLRDVRARYDLRNNVGRGALVTVLWNCYSANYMEEPQGCSATEYIFGGFGQSSIGVTRSAGTYFLFDQFGVNEDTNPLRSDNKLGDVYLESKKWYYCVSPVSVEHDGRSRFPLMGQILMGNPFVLAKDDLSVSPSSVAGHVRWDWGESIPSAGLHIYQMSDEGEKAYGYSESDSDGLFTFDWLSEGTYRISAELKNGHKTSSSPFVLGYNEDIVIDDLVFTETRDIITVHDTWEFDLTENQNPDDEGDFWYDPAFNADGWMSGKAPFNNYLPEPTDGTALDPLGYILWMYLRKTFSVNDPAHFQLNISADTEIDIYINGTEYTANPHYIGAYLPPRLGPDYWNITLTAGDLADYITQGENTVAIKMWGRGLIDVTAFEYNNSPSYLYENLTNGDVDGDGFIDQIRLKHNNGYTFIEIDSSSVIGGSYEVKYTLPSSHIEEALWFTGDVNGDLLTDVIKIIPFEGKAYFHVYFSDGDVFYMEDWTPDDCSFNSAANWMIFDFNSDQRSDFATYNSSEENIIHDIYLSGQGQFFNFIAQVYEAESPDNQLFGNTYIMKRENLSGGKGVDGFDVNLGSYLEFKGIEAPESGSYTIRVHYFNDWYDRTLHISANGNQPITLNLVGDPVGLQYVDTLIDLTAGINTIRFDGTPWLTPVDKIEIISENPDPLKRLSIYEAENPVNDIPGTTSILHSPFYSGGAKVSNFTVGPDNYIQFNEITAPEDGIYTVIVGYDQSRGLKAQLQVDNKDPHQIYFQQAERIEQLFFKVYLASNSLHSFRFYSPSDDLPDIDFLIVGKEFPAADEYSVITWKDRIGVEASSTSIRKTGSEVDWDSGAASVTTFIGNGGIEFSPSQHDKFLICGLSVVNSDNDFRSIDYALSLTDRQRVAIYEGGVNHSIGDIVYYAGNTLRIERIGRDIVYSINGFELYRGVSALSPSTELMFDVSFYNPGGGIEKFRWLECEKAVLTDVTGADLVNNSITKNEDTVNLYGGSASVNSFIGDGGVEFIPDQQYLSIVCGLSHTNQDHTIQSIEYAIQLHNDSAISIYENSVSIDLPGRFYQAGDLFQVLRVGTDIVYTINNFELHRSVNEVVSGDPLFIAVSTMIPGSRIRNIEWVSSVNTTFLSDNEPPVISATGSDGWTAELESPAMATAQWAGIGESDITAWFYSLNSSNGPWTAIEIPEIFGFNEGITQVWFYAMDMAGNPSGVTSCSVYLDLQPPYYILEQAIDAEGNYYFPDNVLNQTPWLSTVSVTFEAGASDDNGVPDYSGVVARLWTTDPSLPDDQWNSGFPILITQEGVTSFEYKVIDGAGLSTSSSYTVRIDRTNPVISEIGSLNRLYFHQDSGIDFLTYPAAVDTHSGVASDSWEYAFTEDPAEWIPLSQGISVNSLPEGDHLLYVRVSDQAGNFTISSNGLPVKVDRTAPEILGIEVTAEGELLNIGDYISEDLIQIEIRTEDFYAGDIAGEIDRYEYVFFRSDLPPGSVNQIDAGEPIILDTEILESSAYTLLVTAFDKAGNTSEQVSFILHIENTIPGSPQIESLTHPEAIVPEDAVSIQDGIFLFKPNAENPAGPTGLSGYRWELLSGMTVETAVMLYSGIENDNRLELNEIEDNEAYNFYYLCVWAMGNNGKESEYPGVYSFRIDSTPPQDLRILSTSHSNSEIYYNSATGIITWNQPADFTGISTYYYLASDIPVLPDPLPPDYSHSETWESLSTRSAALDLKSVVNGENAGEVYVAVCAEDYSGNRLYDQIRLRFDTIKPGAAGFFLATDSENQTVHVTWDMPTDNIIDGVDHSEVQLLRLETDNSLTPVTGWVTVSAQNPQEHTFLGVNPDENLIYVVYLTVYDKACNSQQYYQGVSFSGNPVNITLATPYETNLGGYIVYGEYNAATGIGTAFLQLPQLLDFRITSVPQEKIELIDTVFIDDEFSSGSNSLVVYDVTVSGYALSGTGISISENTGLVFNQVTYSVALNEITTKDFVYTDLSVSSPPQCLMSEVLLSETEGFILRSLLPPIEGEIEPQTGWTFTSIMGTGFGENTWFLDTAKLDISNISENVNAYVLEDDLPVYQLDVAHIGITPGMNPVDGNIVSDFYLETMNNRFLVEEAIIKDDQIIILQARLLPEQGLTTDDIIIENFSILITGQVMAKEDFNFTPFTITLSDGTIINVYELEIIDNSLIITNGELTGDGSFMLNGLTLTENGIENISQTVISGFTHMFFGFTVQEGTGTWQDGVISLDQCTILLPVNYPVGQTILSGLAINQEDMSVISPGTGILETDLTLGYGSPVAINGIRLDIDGIYAQTVTIQAPAFLNMDSPQIQFSDLLLYTDGTAGTSEEATGFSLSLNGYSFTDVNVFFKTDHLVLNNLTMTLPDNYEPSFLILDGLAASMDNILEPASSSYWMNLDSDDWHFELFNITLGQDGLFCEALVELPYEFGYRTIRYNNFRILPDGGYETGLSQDEVYINIHDWLCRATGLSFIQVDGQQMILLETVNIILHSTMGWGELTVPDVTLRPDGSVYSSGTGTGTVNFLSANGFEVDATGYKFTEHGLYLNGMVYFPEGLGENTGVEFTNLEIALESDGTIITPTAPGPVTYYLGGWDLTANEITFDREGLTIMETRADLFNVTEIIFPPITFFPDGEIKINGYSFEGFTFPDNPDSPVRLSVTEFWLDQRGVNARAFVNLPPSLGPDAVIYFDRLTIHPDGSFSSEIIVPQLEFTIEGVNFYFQNIELMEEYFSIGQAVITLPPSLDEKNIRISNLKITYDGDFILGGLGVDPFELWGYTIYLDNFSYNNDLFTFEGGVRLPYDFFIDEIAGLRINIDHFTYDLSADVVDFQVSVTESFSFKILNDQYTIQVNGLIVNKQMFELTQAVLILPPDIPIESVTVDGFVINIDTQEITLDEVSIDNLVFDYEGNHFELSASISEEGLDLTGTVVLSPDLPGSIGGSILTVNTFEFSSSGIGDIDASWTIGENNDLSIFDTLVLHSGSTLGFSKTGETVRITIDNGYVSLGPNFPSELVGKGGPIEAFDLEFNENGPQLNAFIVSSDSLSLSFEGLDIENTVLGMEWIVDEIDPTTGVMLFRLGGADGLPAEITLAGDKYPEGLRGKTIEIFQFEFDSQFENLKFNAALPLPGTTKIFEGIYLINRTGENAPIARIGVLYNETSEAFEFDIQGTLQFDDTFPEGIAGLEVDIFNLSFDTNWDLLALDIVANLPANLEVLNALTIQSGSLHISKLNESDLLFDLGGVVTLKEELLQYLNFYEPYPVFTLSRLQVTSAGEFLGMDVSVNSLNAGLFNVMNLNNGIIEVSSTDGDNVTFRFGGQLSFQPGLAETFNNPQFELDFEYSTVGGLEHINASLISPVECHPIDGITLTLSSLTISEEDFGIGGMLAFDETPIWPENLRGLPITLTSFRMNWDGDITEIAAGIDHLTINLFGFTTEIENLTLGADEISLGSAEFILPDALDNASVIINGPRFSYDGEFHYDSITLGKTEYEFAGFRIALEEPDIVIDGENSYISISELHILLPSFIGGSSIDLQNVIINSQGLQISGGRIDIPDFQLAGGLGFKEMYIQFENTFDENLQKYTYFIAGGGKIMIPGAGTFGVDVSFTNISPVYPIGLKRAYFEYTVSGLGLPLGATGLYLNGISGGIAFGPPDELPQEIRGMFDNGTRLQLGVTMVGQAGGSVLRAGTTVWIDITDWDWAFEGNVTILNGIMRGEIVAALTNQGFYGSFKFSLSFVRGQVRVYVFKKGRKTLVSGTGYLQFGIGRGSILNYSFRIWPFKRVYIVIPTKHYWLPKINAEFGVFRKSGRDISGFKGWVKVPVLGMVGIFLPSKGKPSFTNINKYKLYKPSWARSGSKSSSSITGYVPYVPVENTVVNGGFVALDRTSQTQSIENFVFTVPGLKVKEAAIATHRRSIKVEDIRTLNRNTSVDSEVTEEVERIVFILSYNEGDPVLTATDRNGVIYSEGHPDVSIERHEFGIIMIVMNPEPGEWHCEVSNALNPNTYSLQIFGKEKIPEVEIFNPSFSGEIVGGSYTVSGKADLAKPEEAEVIIYLATVQGELYGMEVAATTTDTEGNFTTTFDIDGLEEGTYYLFAELNTEAAGGIKAEAPGSINIIHSTPVLPPALFTANATENNDVEVTFEDVNGRRTKGFELRVENITRTTEEIINLGYLTSTTIPGFKENEEVSLSVRSIDFKNTPSVWCDPVILTIVPQVETHNSFTITESTVNLETLIGTTMEYTLTYNNPNPEILNNAFDLMEARIYTGLPGIQVGFDKDFYDLTTGTGEIILSLYSETTIGPGAYEITLLFNNKANKAINQEVNLHITADYPEPYIVSIEPDIWNNLYPVDLAIIGESFFEGSRLFVDNIEYPITSLEYNEIITAIPAGITASENMEIRVVGPNGLETTYYAEVVEPIFNFIGLVTEAQVTQGSSTDFLMTIAGENDFSGTAQLNLLSASQGLLVNPASLTIGEDDISAITVTAESDAPIGTHQVVFESDYNTQVTFYVTVASGTVAPYISGLSQLTVFPGDVITVFGYQFGDSGILSLEGQDIPVTDWSDARIIFTVPFDVTTGDLMVTRNSDGLVSNVVKLYVKAEGFTIYADPEDILVQSGDTEKEVGLTVMGYAGYVDLDAASSSPFISTSLAESHIIPNGNTQLFLSIDPAIENGTYTIGITGVSPQYTHTINLTITVGEAFEIATDNLPVAMEQALYSVQLTTNHGTGYIDYSIIEGSLPVGLTLLTSGNIQGRPTEPDARYVTIQALDEEGRETSKEFLLTVIENSWSMSEKDPGRSRYNMTGGPADNRTRWQTIVQGADEILAGNKRIFVLGTTEITGLDSANCALIYTIAGEFTDYALNGGDLYLLDTLGTFICADASYGHIKWTRDNINGFMTNGSELYLADSTGLKIMNPLTGTLVQEISLIINGDDLVLWQGNRLLRIAGSSIDEFDGTGWSSVLSDSQGETIVDVAADELELAYLSGNGRLVVQTRENGFIRETDTGLNNAIIILAQARITVAGHDGMKIYERASLDLAVSNNLNVRGIAGALEKDYICSIEGLRAVNVYTGEVIWENTSQEALDLALAGEKLYALFTDGSIYCYNGPVNIVPPITTLQADQVPDSNGWYINNTTITLTSEDNETFAEKIYYRLNSPDFLEYTGPIALPEGYNSLVYYAVDSHGRREADNISNLLADYEPPVLTYELLGTAFNDYWFHSPVTITSEAEDNVSGLLEHKIALEEGGFHNFSNGPKDYMDQRENHITLVALDNVLHSVEVPLDFGIDLEDPVVDITTRLESGYAMITLESSDSFSGVAKTEYQVDSGPIELYTGRIILPVSGEHTFTYSSTDVSGRTSGWHTVILEIPAYHTGDWIDEITYSVSCTGQGLFRNIQPGDQLYCPSDLPENTLKALPAYVIGSDYLRLNIDDIYASGDVVTFKALKNIEVYIFEHAESTADISSWELIEENYPVEPNMYFVLGADIYKRSFAPGEICEIPATSEGHPNLVFITYNPVNDLAILEPIPGTELVPFTSVPLFGYFYGQVVNEYTWEWKLVTESTWNILTPGQSQTLDLPYVPVTTGVDIKLTCITNSGKVYSKIERYSLVNQCDIKLMNPGPGMKYMPGETIGLEYSATDYLGQIIDSLDVTWFTSTDQISWIPVSGSTITTPGVTGTFYLRAEAGSAPGYMQDKIFHITISELPGPLVIAFGEETPETPYTTGEILSLHENGFLYGFNQDHSTECESHEVSVFGQVFTIYDVRLLENGNFQVYTGQGSFYIVLISGPLQSSDTYNLTIEDQDFIVHEAFFDSHVIGTYLDITDNILTISGSTGLPVIGIIVQRIPSGL